MYAFVGCRLIGADCQPRWKAEAHYLRAVQGFLQSGPQVVLQLVLLLKGVIIHSLRDTIRHLLESKGFEWSFFTGKRSNGLQYIIMLGVSSSSNSTNRIKIPFSRSIKHEISCLS
jgi:hypothetical protein